VRNRSIAGLGTLLIVLSLWGCTPAPPVVTGFSCNEFRSDPHREGHHSVMSGEVFSVTFCSNPTTGYNWAAPEIVDPTVVELVSQDFTPPTGSMDGAPGHVKFTFRALRPGATVMLLAYGQPWDGGEKGAWTYQASVSVR